LRLKADQYPVDASLEIAFNINVKNFCVFLRFLRDNITVSVENIF